MDKKLGPVGMDFVHEGFKFLVHPLVSVKPLPAHWVFKRGDAREDCDIDLLLLLDKETLTLEDRMRLMEPLYEIELETGVLINPFVETLRKWGKRFTPFYENVMREGVAL